MLLVDILTEQVVESGQRADSSHLYETFAERELAKWRMVDYDVVRFLNDSRIDPHA